MPLSIISTSSFTYGVFYAGGITFNGSFGVFVKA
jgi:hypothetical protein